MIENDEFFDGRYKGKVIQVHSNLRGEVKDEVVQQLLTVESPDNPVEIVIHVNMLKEGWDVTNLYTIVPLRAANSKTLVEQSIGRGLRLPYGKRVGVPAVDRLTIVSHDKFQEIVEKVEEIMRPVQGKLELEGAYEKPDVVKVVKKTTEVYTKLCIDIPRILVVPLGEMTVGYADFDLDLANMNPQSVEQSILIQHLRTHEQYKVVDGDGIVAEKRPEDYLVRGLRDFNDISYDDHADLLYKLAGQVVEHLRGYLASEDEVINVLQYHQQMLVNLIYSGMQAHCQESVDGDAGYEVKISKGFHRLKPGNFSVDANEDVRDFRAPVPNPSKITSMIFGEFSKSLYAQQKFDSDPERRFSVVLENDNVVMKWVKPSKADLQIHYGREADGYTPDFVVETADGMFLCEPKQADQMDNAIVLAKARAATMWCKHATDHCEKPWTYLLIPHDQIDESETLAGLAAAHTFTI